MKTPGSQTPSLRLRLVCLLAVDVAALVAVGGASGRFHLRYTDLAVAFAVVAAATALGRLFLARPAGPARAATTRPSFDQTKRLLVLALLIGLIAYVGGRGTWGSFSAEATNPGSSLAAGTLALGDRVNSGSTCYSYSADSHDNDAGACAPIMSPTDLAPGAVTPIGSGAPPASAPANGVSNFFAKLALTNEGSLDSSSLTFYGPYANAALNAKIDTGTAVGSLTVAGFEGTVAVGDQITVSYGGTSQTFCADTTATPTAAAPVTTIAVAATAGSCAKPTTAAADFPVGSRVLDVSTDTGPTNTDCYDAKLASTATWNFNGTTVNQLCQTAFLWIQEQTGGRNHCWFGDGSSFDSGTAVGANDAAAGMCVTPTTMTLTGTKASGAASYSLDVGTLGGNVRAGDSVAIAENGTTTTCSSSASRYLGDDTSATPLALAGCSTVGSATTYDSSAAIYDATAFGDLNTTASHTASTISAFDTSHNPAAPVAMAPLTGAAPVGTPSGSGTTPLAAGATRTYYVGVYFPNPGSNQNTLQGVYSTFGIGWHLAQ